MSRRMLGRLLALALVASPMAACSEPLQGADLWEQNCAACHEPGGEGGVLDATSDAAGMSDALLASIIREGVGTMPSFPRLSDAQVDGLVAYMRQLQAGR